MHNLQFVLHRYNMLDPMLRATGFPDGDVAGPDGLSPFPGNMNQLVFELEAYTAALTVGAQLFPTVIVPAE
jgi:UDP-sugar pyrophosphorylase